MKDLYSVSGLSKQALHASNKRDQERYESDQRIVEICRKERRLHKRMSSRKIYSRYRAESPYGRDKFEQVAFAYGFKVRVRRSVMKTTYPISGSGFANILEGQELTGADQAWASDLFYVRVQGEHWYGISICDVYTRELLALHVSRTMKAEELAKAIQEAKKYRGKSSYEECIFHSDRGTQYDSVQIKGLIKELGMRQSMCKLPQENAYAERVQGTIKIEYLQDQELSPESIKRIFKKIKELYNERRPHLSLQNTAPAVFARGLDAVAMEHRHKQRIYVWEHPLLTTTRILTKEKRSKKEKVNINNN